jgi:hypothetical protein
MTPAHLDEGLKRGMCSALMPGPLLFAHNLQEQKIVVERVKKKNAVIERKIIHSIVFLFLHP